MPMSPKLKELFDMAEQMAVDLFMQHGSIGPTYWFVDAKGERGVAPSPPFEKELALALMRAFFELREATMMVFFDEAWAIQVQSREEMPDDLSTSKDPRRREVIHFNMEETATGTFIVGERPIIREPGKKPRLGPLELHEYGYTSGRMVGMLPRPKGAKLS